MTKAFPLLLSFLIATFTANHPAFANKSFYPAIESAHLKDIDFKTLRHRADVRTTFKQHTFHGKIYYELRVTGKGSFEKYENTRWRITSLLIPDGNFIKPLWTRCVLTDITTERTITRETRFNYKRKKIFLTLQDSTHKTRKRSVLPIKGLTAEYASVNYFLRPFFSKISKGKSHSFYFLTIDGNLYKIKINYAGLENISLSSDMKTAHKAHLTADFGILSPIINRLAPPTHVWFGDQTPFPFLKYQGLETDKGSTFITLTNEL